MIQILNVNIFFSLSCTLSSSITHTHIYTYTQTADRRKKVLCFQLLQINRTGFESKIKIKKGVEMILHVLDGLIFILLIPLLTPQFKDYLHEPRNNFCQCQIVFCFISLSLVSIMWWTCLIFNCLMILKRSMLEDVL